jgi:type IV secretion system protein VirB10
MTSPAPAQTIVVPEGTRIPATLSSSITTKSARRGTAVRAVTAFPVTVGTQVAIPIGTYMEGVIDKVTRGSSDISSLHIHFTRMVYANGYTVDIDGINTDAKAMRPQFDRGSNSLEPAAFASESAPHLVLVAQQSPEPPPLPHPGPSMGTAIGIGVGLTAAGIIGAILAVHHSRASNGVLFDAGTQFEMVLQSPLTLNAASVAAAIANPVAQ